MTNQKLEYEEVKISGLVLNRKNPRINDKAAERLTKGIEAYGFINPVVVNKRNNMVLAGHTRIKALKKMGKKTVPVLFVDMDEATARGFSIWDNKSGEFSEWDDELLKLEIQDLFDLDFDIDLTGFDLEDFDIDKEEESGGLTDDDDVPDVPEEPICKLGDLWLLSKHRVLCGDSTDKSQVERLMNGEKADMVFTDPPYGISVVASNGKIGGSVLAQNQTYKPVAGDDKDFDPSQILGLSDLVLIWGANYFSDKLPIGQWIVWDKDRPHGTTFSDCELAWISRDGVAVKKYKCTWNGMIREGESDKRVHPTQKPIKMCSEVISDFSEKTDIILDLFLGSGSTLIACQKTNRTCYGMELDPHYVQVILQRWSEYSGKDPVREDGVKFSELNAATGQNRSERSTNNIEQATYET